MNMNKFLIILGLIFCVIEVAIGKIKTSVRIINGESAILKQFPYMVRLKILTVPNGECKKCGGSLIDKRWVLTAAHCLINHESIIKTLRHNLTAYIGGVNDRKTDEFQIISVPGNPNFIVHPEFVTARNDIGLVHLPEEARINEFVQVISLPPPDIGKLENEVMTVAGWGIVDSTVGDSTHILQYVDMKVMKNKECEKKIPKEANVERMFCADTSSGKNICRGDSGGPAVIKMKNNQKMVVGIASRGNCNKTLPSEFTRVSFYLNWIKNTMRNF